MLGTLCKSLAIAAVLIVVGCDHQASRIACDWGNRWFFYRRFDKAIEHYDAAIELDPTIAVNYSYRGQARNYKGEYFKALEDLEKAVELDIQGEPAAQTYNALAWLLSTCPEGRFRDGPRALKLAKHACKLSDYENAAIVDTLAAAYAEIGNFEEAIKWQEKAIKLAENAWVQGQLIDHLELYKQGRPCREPGG